MNWWWSTYERFRPLIAVLAAVVVFASFGFVIYRMMFPPAPFQPQSWEPTAYFYDLNTGDLFTAPADRPGPIETDSGLHQGMPAGVRAHVYACASCDDPSRRFIAWIEVPIAALAASDPQEYEQFAHRDISQGEVATTMIRRPDGDKWFPADSPEAQAILNEISSRCTSGERVFRCRPPARPQE